MKIKVIAHQWYNGDVCVCYTNKWLNFNLVLQDLLLQDLLWIWILYKGERNYDYPWMNCLRRSRCHWRCHWFCTALALALSLSLSANVLVLVKTKFFIDSNFLSRSDENGSNSRLVAVCCAITMKTYICITICQW